MELNDLILLAAADIYSAYLPTYRGVNAMKQAVQDARRLWKEVLNKENDID